MTWNFTAELQLKCLTNQTGSKRSITDPFNQKQGYCAIPYPFPARIFLQCTISLSHINWIFLYHWGIQTYTNFHMTNKADTLILLTSGSTYARYYKRARFSLLCVLCIAIKFSKSDCVSILSNISTIDQSAIMSSWKKSTYPWNSWLPSQVRKVTSPLY